ncbi:hypothetical protein LEP1GSC125_4256 [Leptospira mayottensis 200901122]|uniref:Uncharacterized protein n=1 Tax=Leptospira mayottensis 200901122 TaxID=1193010 RepID=A0AA87SYP0_9LEPT|nr:hypothetical protein [Leptospira mayottensis]EKS01506.1 hypothetical protein LEP1GSC125_4256 [Leptospira mayottensis 200901122]
MRKKEKIYFLILGLKAFPKNLGHEIHRNLATKDCSKAYKPLRKWGVPAFYYELTE